MKEMMIDMADLQTKDILLSLVKKIKKSKSLPKEDSKMVDDNFWNLF